MRTPEITGGSLPVVYLETQEGSRAAGWSLAEIKQRMPVSSVEIARRTGRSKTLVSLVLSGKKRSATVEDVIASLLGKTREEVFGRTMRRGTSRKGVVK